MGGSVCLLFLWWLGGGGGRGDFASILKVVFCVTQI